MLYKIDKSFPCYVINFDPLTIEEKEQAINLVRINYERHLAQGSNEWNFTIDIGENKHLFDKIYNAILIELNKYTKITLNEKAFTTIEKQNTMYISYHKSGHNFAKYDCNGLGVYHNHKHNRVLFGQPVDIGVIYYLYITNGKGGNLDFRKQTVMYSDGTTENIMENEIYHKHSHKIEDTITGKRITVQEEISYQPKTNDMIFLPQTLDHRVAAISEGERIALVFQIPTIESGTEILKSLEGMEK